jgi:D-glycero-D-manno-heptose 1,7-bisphosphate phosphatase
MLAAEGLFLEAIYYCPHGPSDGCRCRKPAPGLVLDAMADFGFAREDAVLIGDAEADMGAAAARGVKGVRVAPDFLMAARQAIDYFRGRQTKRRPCM